MGNILKLSCKILSVGAVAILLVHSATFMLGQIQSTNAVSAATLILLALAFALNLFRIRRPLAITVALVHSVAALYLTYVLTNMMFALGESGSKQGLWRFVAPVIFVIVASVLSVAYNLRRAVKHAGTA